MLLRKSSLAEGAANSEARLNHLMAWLEDHFAEDVCWEEVAAQFSLSLRTLHRQLKQQTGLTPAALPEPGAVDEGAPSAAAQR
nr:transcriptional activator RhaS [Raoultella sp. NCTC 9187]